MSLQIWESSLWIPFDRSLIKILHLVCPSNSSLGNLVLILLHRETCQSSLDLCLSFKLMFYLWEKKIVPSLLTFFYFLLRHLWSWHLVKTVLKAWINYFHVLSLTHTDTHNIFPALVPRFKATGVTFKSILSSHLQTALAFSLPAAPLVDFS